MEKRRIRLEIHGAVIGLVTQETDEYMESLAREVEQAVESIHAAAPALTGEAAALTAALGYCDDLHKRSAPGEDPRVGELTRQIAHLQAENARLEAENLRLVREKSRLEAAREEPRETPAPAAEEPPVEKHQGNPLRYEDQLDQLGLVTFFEQETEDED